jgi:hypothetical protein
MRYLVAIIFALVGAFIAIKFLSGPVANWATFGPKFESSDDADNLNQLVYIGVNLVGMIVGWTIGWAIGGPLSRRSGRRPQ